MEIYKLLVFFIMVSSAAAFVYQSDLTDLEKNRNLSSVVHNSDTECEKGKCRGQNCNCCPGYVFQKIPFFPATCEKCNCGETYGCKFTGFPPRKVCHCPDGYRQVSGICTDTECDKDDCRGQNCKCCPGYVYRQTGFGSVTCEKCNCGETYGCKFEGFPLRKVCHCPDGYRQVSGICTDSECDKEECNGQGCKCCPGYVHRRTGLFSATCEKCNCGETFGCKYGGFPPRKVCQCPDRYREISGTCKDKCSLIKCQNNGTCDIMNGNAVCKCDDHFTGDFCETDICSMSQCQNGGKCEVMKGKATCICNDNYIGDLCEIDKCSLMTCLNGGNCEVRNQKPVCVCTGNFIGHFCEKKMNPDIEQ